MRVYNRVTVEEITIIHNSIEEMRLNRSRLREKGWSSNVKLSHRERISKRDLEQFKKENPDIKVHVKKGSLGAKPEFFIYLTKHERVVEGEQINKI